MAQFCHHESTWLERGLFDEAEHDFQCHQEAKGQQTPFKLFNPHSNQHPHAPHSPQKGLNSISGEIAKAREHIRSVLNGTDYALTSPCDPVNKKVECLEKQVVSLTSRLEALEKFCKASCNPTTCVPHPTTHDPTTTTCVPPSTTTPAKEEDDDFELFDSDDEEEDDDAEKLKQQRLAAYQAKKDKKPTLIAKSNVIFEVKPWDDETDMKKLEECVRSVKMDGLLLGASQLVPLAYGIKKLQITCVIEDDKVSTEELEEQITAFVDYVQSVDIVAFNKI